jgi:hypothetical protein
MTVHAHEGWVTIGQPDHLVRRWHDQASPNNRVVCVYRKAGVRLANGRGHHLVFKLLPQVEHYL